MQLFVYATHLDVDPEQLIGKIVLVIDVLRATSVIATALHNGANKVQTTAIIEEALAQKNNNPKLMLGGEHNAFKIPGFDLGNSPLEYRSEKIAKKTVLLCTSNGTQAIAKAKNARILIAVCFLNLNVVVKTLGQFNEDVHVICSGTNGTFSLDDGLCAGLIIHELQKVKPINISDFGKLLSLPFKGEQADIFKLISFSKHAKTLIDKGLKADVKACAYLNSTAVIPRWENDGFIDSI